MSTVGVRRCPKCELCMNLTLSFCLFQTVLAPFALCFVLLTGPNLKGCAGVSIKSGKLRCAPKLGTSRVRKCQEEMKSSA